MLYVFNVSIRNASHYALLFYVYSVADLCTECYWQHKFAVSSWCLHDNKSWNRTEAFYIFLHFLLYIIDDSSMHAILLVAIQSIVRSQSMKPVFQKSLWNGINLQKEVVSRVFKMAKKLGAKNVCEQFWFVYLKELYTVSPCSLDEALCFLDE